MSVVMVAMRAVMKPGVRHSPLKPCLAPTTHKPDEIFTVCAVSTSPSALPTPALTYRRSYPRRMEAHRET